LGLQVKQIDINLQVQQPFEGPQAFVSLQCDLDAGANGEAMVILSCHTSHQLRDVAIKQEPDQLVGDDAFLQAIPQTQLELKRKIKKKSGIN
jgi:hypothetical protein